jgi:hypothetical protein
MRVFKVRSAVFQLVFYPFIPVIEAGPVYRDLCIVALKEDYITHAEEDARLWKLQGQILGSMVGEC